VPNRLPLTANSVARAGSIRLRWPNSRQPLRKWQNNHGPTGGPAGQSGARISVRTVLVNWAGLVALWALPYLTLLDHLRLEAARSETLQWSLLVVGALGLVSILYTAWRETLDPAWRAQHGLTLRKRPSRPPTGHVA
jgi:hypothetical protein